MNLLLLLSALLSALAGIGGGTRAPGAAQSVVASTVSTRPSPTVPRAAATRPVAESPALVSVAFLAVRFAVAIVPVMPLWASRRRI